jgi:hypothetical protein
VAKNFSSSCENLKKNFILQLVRNSRRLWIDERMNGGVKKPQKQHLHERLVEERGERGCFIKIYCHVMQERERRGEGSRVLSWIIWDYYNILVKLLYFSEN